MNSRILIDSFLHAEYVRQSCNLTILSSSPLSPPIDLQTTSESEFNVVPTTNDGSQLAEMDVWDVIVLGDGGVGKTALIVQVSDSTPTASSDVPQFTLNCWLGELLPLGRHPTAEPIAFHRGNVVRISHCGC